MSMKIKGGVIIARRAFVEKEYGNEAWLKVMDALPPEDRGFHEGLVLQAGWYPFEIGERLDKAIVEVLGRGDPRIFEDIGAKSARENLTTVHHNFLSPGNPQAFMAKANLIYQFYYNTGYRESEPTGPTSCVMTTYDAETYSATDCLTVMGWYKEALQMCGATDVQISHETCRAKGGPYCRYRISWRI